jgi:hypothetical protein
MKFKYATPEGPLPGDRIQTHTYHLARENGRVWLLDENGVYYRDCDRLPGSLLKTAADVVERQESEYTKDRALIDEFLAREPWC